MFVRVKRQNRTLLSPGRLTGKPPSGSLVVITEGFASGAIGQVERPRGPQGGITNKVPVRLCGPLERVWMLNWRRLRFASLEESKLWGHETYDELRARKTGVTHAVESE